MPAIEYRGIKEGDWVEGIISRRRQLADPKPFPEEVWDEGTYYGQVTFQHDKMTCSHCNGMGIVPPIDYSKSLNYCDVCKRTGKVIDKSGGSLILVTSRAQDQNGKEVIWEPNLNTFTSLRKVDEKSAKGQPAKHSTFETKDGKRVPVGTACKDWIEMQKKLKRAGKKFGDFERWEKALKKGAQG